MDRVKLEALNIEVYDIDRRENVLEGYHSTIYEYGCDTKRVVCGNKSNVTHDMTYRCHDNIVVEITMTSLGS